PWWRPGGLPEPPTRPIIRSSRRFCVRGLGGRSTVGHLALDQGIGVRIPASQPIIPFSPKNLRVHSVGGAQLVPLAFDGCRLSSSRIVEPSDAGVRCEYRWVIAKLWCPTSSCTPLIGAPCIARCEQNV